MMAFRSLHSLLIDSAKAFPDRIAIESATESINYQEFDQISNQLRDRLHHLGVRSGDRVGIYLHKSITAVASIFGILKTGAAYVPVDPNAPASRNAYILSDCSVKVVILERSFKENLTNEIRNLQKEMPRLVLLDGVEHVQSLKNILEYEQERNPAGAAESADSEPDDLAYILYTSGSTGKPKGVMLSHQNAVSFVNWCSEVFQPNEKDRFSSHAPFHFDLSILDIYVPIKHSATLILIDEYLGKDPVPLTKYISEKQISVWYSTPSILSLLVQYGKLESYHYSHLRIILFAGEVFPVKHLCALKSILPEPEYFNLYGPTETNVCTFYKIPEIISEERTEPFPIGKACSHLESNVVNENGTPVSSGEEGELCISGSGVMQGYWNLPEQNSKVFLKTESGKYFYRTGDIVREDVDGNYLYLGRKDRMVKKRGFRIELGEIESALYTHPMVKEAAVIALADQDLGTKIKAFINWDTQDKPSLIQLKKFCSQKLPSYMIPDLFTFLSKLPKTSTDKIDYQKLSGIK